MKSNSQNRIRVHDGERWGEILNPRFYEHLSKKFLQNPIPSLSQRSWERERERGERRRVRITKGEKQKAGLELYTRYKTSEQSLLFVGVGLDYFTIIPLTQVLFWRHFLLIEIAPLPLLNSVESTCPICQRNNKILILTIQVYIIVIFNEIDAIIFLSIENCQIQMLGYYMYHKSGNLETLLVSVQLIEIFFFSLLCL